MVMLGELLSFFYPFPSSNKLDPEKNAKLLIKSWLEIPGIINKIKKGKSIPRALLD